MYIDTRNLPEDFDTSDQWLNNWQDMLQKGKYVADSTKQINTTSTGNGLWDQINKGGQQTYEPYVDPIISVELRLKKLELQNKFLKLKILGMEGKFTQGEIVNIRAMLTSNDEASITLADSIIENA